PALHPSAPPRPRSREDSRSPGLSSLPVDTDTTNIQFPPPLQNSELCDAVAILVLDHVPHRSSNTEEHRQEDENSMRRMIAVLAAALVAPALATASPASAQVAPIDPAAAMKGQLKPKHGVQFSETAKLTYDGRSFMSQTTKGAYEFNKSGVAASDTKFQIKISKDLRELLK